MSDADDKLLVCNQCLGEIGTRSTMTSVDPPDGSTEAYYCNLLFNNTRDTLLRAAHWGCAARTEAGVLWKALPGTPENPLVPANFLWSNKYPAPPWLYSYKFPEDSPIAIRRIREQFQPGEFGSIPLSTGAINLENYNLRGYARFDIGTDIFNSDGLRVDSVVTVMVTSLQYIVIAGTGFFPGDQITLEADTSTPTRVTNLTPAIIKVLTIDGDGGVVTTEMIDGGSFVSIDPDLPLRMFMTETTGLGTGFVCFSIMARREQHTQRVILTNAQNVIIDFTTSNIVIDDWDPGFQNAFMAALEGKLALSLLGDKAMSKLKLEQANMDILEARVRDGNEALTIYDHVPDWLQVRGVASMGSPWVNPPYYGPLFAV